MHIIFNSVFIKKENWSYLLFINYIYWAILISKNILKWIYAVGILNSNRNILIILLSVDFLLRFCFIGIGNIYKFRKSIKNNAFLTFMIIISI